MALPPAAMVQPRAMIKSPRQLGRRTSDHQPPTRSARDFATPFDLMSSQPVYIYYVCARISSEKRLVLNEEQQTSATYHRRSAFGETHLFASYSHGKCSILSLQKRKTLLLLGSNAHRYPIRVPLMSPALKFGTPESGAYLRLL